MQILPSRSLPQCHSISFFCFPFNFLFQTGPLEIAALRDAHQNTLNSSQPEKKTVDRAEKEIQELIDRVTSKMEKCAVTTNAIMTRLLKQEVCFLNSQLSKLKEHGLVGPDSVHALSQAQKEGIVYALVRRRTCILDSNGMVESQRRITLLVEKLKLWMVLKCRDGKRMEADQKNLYVTLVSSATLLDLVACMDEDLVKLCRYEVHWRRRSDKQVAKDSIDGTPIRCNATHTMRIPIRDVLCNSRMKKIFHIPTYEEPMICGNTRRGLAMTAPYGDDWKSEGEGPLEGMIKLEWRAMNSSIRVYGVVVSQDPAST